MADDFLNDPAEQGFSSELDTGSPYAGNRPASGARRATPGEVLSQGFQGDQNAGDFLGLDTEFTAHQDPSQFGGGALDLVPPPTIDSGSYAYAPQAPAPMPESDPVQEFAEAPSAFEFGEDLGTEEGGLASLEEESSSSSKKPLLVGALILAGLGAGGMAYGPQLYARFFGAATSVASKPDAAPAKPAAKPRPGDATSGAAGDASVAALDVAKPAPSESPEPAASAPVEKPAPSVPRFTPLRPSEPSVAEADDLALDREPPSAPQGDVQASLVAPAVPPSLAFPDLAGGEYEWASADQLELIWRGAEVPLEAVDAPAKTLMPRVGNVRVFMTTGDVFEGRLYAVGQRRVWIDAEPGRVGLDGDKVEKIEVLPPQPDNVRSSDGQMVAGGKSVRVRVPGGMLYGKVLKAEGEDVTLQLDQGGRVRVKASELQDLGSGRAKVVRQ